MKKWMIVGLLALTLCGCGAEETFETVADVWVTEAAAEMREVAVTLPGEAAVPAIESSSGRMYLCEGYEVYIQTMDAGDLNATIQTVSGYAAEELTVMETELDGVSRYEFVWASAGEKGERLGQGVILDDGNYHYVMSVLRDAETTKTSQVVWSEVFQSFRLV